MQKSFDSFNNGAMQFLDLSKMPNINMSQFMPFDDIPTSQKVKKKKKQKEEKEQKPLTMADVPAPHKDQGNA